jgi:hypothetical protein
MDESFFSCIWSHHSVSHSLLAGLAGDHDITAVHPHPHIPARDKERRTVMAVPAPECPVDPDPLAHGDPLREFHIPVTPFRMIGERLFSLSEQHLNTFPCNHACRRVP